MYEWLDQLTRAIEASKPAVLLTVAEVKGSTPREAGAKLVVTPDATYGSIGGGNLEHQAIRSARSMLASRTRSPRVEKMPLGPTLGQCCGGHVTIALEPITDGDRGWVTRAKTALEAGQLVVTVSGLKDAQHPKQFALADQLEDIKRLLPGLSRAVERAAQGVQPARIVKDKSGSGGVYLIERLFDSRPVLVLFGAGHVGRALVRVLDGAPIRVLWVDSRPDEFPSRIPANAKSRVTERPLNEVTAAPAGSMYLVMTHSHPIDLAICEAVLRRDDFAYLGLIGSKTKKERFLRQLRAGGIDESNLGRLVCPIGVEGVVGKDPTEIAIAVAAQLLQVVGNANAARRPTQSQEAVYADAELFG